MDNNFFQIDTFWVLIGGLASLITIVGLFLRKKRRSNVTNKLKKTKVKKNYVGGDKGLNETRSQKVKNDLKDIEIGGDYTGGSSK